MLVQILIPLYYVGPVFPMSSLQPLQLPKVGLNLCSPCVKLCVPVLVCAGLNGCEMWAAGENRTDMSRRI